MSRSVGKGTCWSLVQHDSQACVSPSQPVFPLQASGSEMVAFVFPKPDMVTEDASYVPPRVLRTQTPHPSPLGPHKLPSVSRAQLFKEPTTLP